MDWSSPKAISRATQQQRAKAISTTGTKTLSEQQRATTKESPVKHPSKVSNFTIPKPSEDNVLKLLLRVIDFHNYDHGRYPVPQLTSTHAQWTGHVPGVNDAERGSEVSEVEKYLQIAKATSSPIVIFFVYGGAFYMNGPSSHRKIYTKLAKMTGGRCLCVQQRLAPQNPFPAALLDIFLGYLALLSPPAGSPHEPVPASSIILAGISSGACLALSLLQTLLTIRNQKWASSLWLHGRKVHLELPAGFTAISATPDLTNGFPSFKRNAEFDLLQNPPPSILPGFPTCEIWPSDPPRGNVYCDLSMLHHPVVSPTAAADWSGAPPVWFSSGQEQVIDAVRFLSQLASSQGVSVILKEYEAMPHFFAVRYMESPQATKVWQEWAQVCRDMVEGKNLSSKACFVEANGLREREEDIRSLTAWSIDEVRQLMKRTSSSFWDFTGQKRENSVL